MTTRQVGDRLAQASPSTIAFIRSITPALAAASLVELTALGDLTYGADQGLTPELGWNILGATLPVAGGAAGALTSATVDPTVRAALDGMLYSAKGAKELKRNQPGSEHLNRVDAVANKRYQEYVRQGVANPREAVMAGAMRRLGIGTSIGAIAASLPALAAMSGDWPQWQQEGR